MVPAQRLRPSLYSLPSTHPQDDTMPTLAPSAPAAATIPGPGSLPQPKRWTDATGYKRPPAAVKAVWAAIKRCAGMGQESREYHGTLTPGHEATPWTDPAARGHGYSMPLSGTQSPEAVRRYCAIGERYGWALSLDNLDRVAADCMALIRAAADPASGILTIQDQRKPADVQAKERAEAEAREADRKAKAEAKDRAEREADPEGYAIRRARGAEQCALLREAFRKRGWNQRAVTVRNESYSMGSSFHVTILDPSAIHDMAELRRLVNTSERIDRCEASGEILSGGNRFAHLQYSDQAQAMLRAPYVDACAATLVALRAEPAGSRSLLPIAGTSYGLGIESAGHRAVLWDLAKDGGGYKGHGVDLHAPTEARARSAAESLALSIGTWLHDAGTHPCQQQQHAAPAAAEDAPANAAPPGWRIERHEHTKRHRTMVLAIPEGRTDQATFQRWSIHAQDMGGWYSRKWGRTPGGFAWWADEDGDAQARAFIAWTRGGPGPKGDPTSGPSPEDVREGIALVQRDLDSLQPALTKWARGGEHGPTPSPGGVFPSLLACSMGKAFRVLAIERTTEAANAACDRTGGGVLCEVYPVLAGNRTGAPCLVSGGIIVAALTPEPADACQYPAPDVQSPLKLTNGVRLLVARSDGQWGLVLGIDEAGSTRKGDELRRYLAANAYARKPVEISQLPDGRQIFVDAYGMGYGPWRRPQTPAPAPARANAATQTAAQYREAKGAELRQGVNASAADRVDALAAKLETDAAHKLAPRLENTPKRQREAGSARVDGYRMQRAAAILRAWAAAARTGFPPGISLASVATPTKAEALQVAAKPYDREGRSGYYDAPMEVTDPNAWTDTSPRACALRALRALLTAADAQRDQAQAQAQAKAAELAALRRSDLPGFFPTPEPLARRMIELAGGNLEGLTVLDPSCGIGSLLDLAAEAGAMCYGFEIVPKLAAYCHKWSLARMVECRDFLDIPLADVVANRCGFLAGSGLASRGADVVLMNPPFEKGAAPVHVRHALRFLKPGGVLVAVVPSQVRSKGELEDLAPEWHDVEPGAFSSAREAFRQTGVAVALCVLRREG